MCCPYSQLECHLSLESEICMSFFFFKPQTAVTEQLNTIFQWESAVSSQHILLFPGSRVSDCQTVCAWVYVKLKKIIIKKKSLSTAVALADDSNP